MWPLAWKGKKLMRPDEQPSPPGRDSAGAGNIKSGVIEETLKTEKIQIERKSFVFALKENPRGRFLRITEDVGGRRDTIIILAPGLDDFNKVLEGMVRVSGEIPGKSA